MNKLNKIWVSCLAALLSLAMVVVGHCPNCERVQADTIAPNSKASVLMEFGTGQILNEENGEQQLPIASVTKLMTILLVLENIDSGEIEPDKILVASSTAAGMGGSQVFIDANAEYSVEKLLRAVIIASANDASVALAEEIGGSESGFAQMMNARATELGLINTHYVNSTGLPAVNQYSCARDVAVVMRELLKHPTYFEISKVWMEDFQHPSGRVTEMANTNKLVRFYKGCDAGKTGSTNQAGYCLAATAKRNNMRLISVVLGASASKERFADASAQFDWGFGNFESVKLVDSSADLGKEVILQKSSAETVKINAGEDFWSLTKKGEKNQIEVNTELPEKLSAPLRAGTVVGKIVLTKEGAVQKEIDVVVTEDIPGRGYFGTVREVLKGWQW